MEKYREPSGGSGNMRMNRESSGGGGGGVSDYPRRETSWNRMRTHETAQPLRVETLEICPLCGEPTPGSHKCGELAEYLGTLSTDSPIYKLLSPIFDEAKKLSQGSMEISFTGKRPRDEGGVSPYRVKED